MALQSDNGTRSLQTAAAVLLAGLVFAAPVRGATSEPGEMVLLEGVDGLALDQPRAIFQFREPSDPPGEGEVVGPGFNYAGLLDTGAQAILLAGRAYTEEDGVTLDPDMYEQETRDDGSLVYYEELGVAGTHLFELYVQHDMVLAEPDEGRVAGALPEVRMIGDPNLDFGSFSAIIGTPGMVDRVSILDLTPLAGPELSLLDTEFATSSPPETDHSYHIDFDLLPPDPSSGRMQEGDPEPTLEALPMMETTVRHGNLTTSRDLILDTGGQLSIVSYDTANSLGIDPEEDAEDWLPVDGVGGQTEIPLILLDEITVPTREGVDLVFRDWVVGAIDIAGLDGVFGMNALTAGYFEALESEDPDDRGWFDTVVFDFTEETWVMRLDMNPLYNNPVPIPEPGSLALLGAGALALLWRRRRSA